MYIIESAAPALIDADLSLPLPPRLLAAIATQHADVARFDLVDEPAPGERESVRVFRSATHDIWLIRWGIGSETALHDHGDSAGALYVSAGELVEHRPNPAGWGPPLRRTLREQGVRPMPAAHVHRVANESITVAASIHVYSPPLETMRHFEFTHDSELRMIRREVVNEPQSPFA